ncbi:MAG: methylated-DNA--[protein]-cysteine S-methyltransferase [SAR324 cluster bacterium]|nr:methylated-DNA--[protein]-cysteine S-methyltransferase [SAR324 cluster bacterium]
MPENFLALQRFDSPLGQIVMAARNDHICRIDFETLSYQPFDTEALERKGLRIVEQETEVLAEAQRQLEEYFDGKRFEFDLPLAFEGTTFQQQAWQALREIPYGETHSYQQQAQRLGDPRFARAVGHANGRNPISIIVPCHRVIGKNGKLTGFASGVDKKAKLLELETHYRPFTLE